MDEFITNILETYSQRPVTIAVPQAPPRYAPFGTWALSDDQQIKDKLSYVNQFRDVFISPKMGDVWVFQWLDLDNGLPVSFDTDPDYLTKTGVDSYQAIWFNESPLTEDQWVAAQISLMSKYSSDPVSANPGSYARVPGSFSFKRNFQTEVL